MTPVMILIEALTANFHESNPTVITETALQ